MAREGVDDAAVQNSFARMTAFVAGWNSAHAYVHDAVKLHQEWANERLKTLGDDASFAISAGREFMEATSRVFADRTNGSIPST
jgi:hypothetical protein